MNTPTEADVKLSKKGERLETEGGRLTIFLFEWVPAIYKFRLTQI
jgi:hypothetical protein